MPTERVRQSSDGEELVAFEELPPASLAGEDPDPRAGTVERRQRALAERPPTPGRRPLRPTTHPSPDR